VSDLLGDMSYSKIRDERGMPFASFCAMPPCQAGGTAMSNISRRRFLSASSAVAACTALGLRAQSDFPAKPISLAIGYPPGGNSDVLSRALGVLVGKTLGQSVVIENRPGAGGVVAMTQIAKAAPDGYTIGYVSNAFFTVTPALTPVPFDPMKDLEPVAFIGTNVNVLAVHPEIPATTIPEFIAYAKANPGKLNYGSSGSATGNHISTEYMLSVLGIQATHVPYKGSGPAMLDLAAGRLQFMIDSGLMTYVRAGKVRAIGICEGGKTVEGHPQLKSFADVVPNWSAPEWYNFIVVPARTPASIKDKLTHAFRVAVSDPELVSRMRAGSYELGSIAPDALRARLDAEAVTMKELLRKAEIRIS
jgi:tripartite-type tricarboxylate transporter receptor subunit TctC